MVREGGRALLLIGLLAVVMSAGGPIRAQDASGLPARLHQGTCDALGPIAFELTRVGAATSIDGTPVPATATIGRADAPQVMQSVTTLDASLAELIETPHALAVSEPGERVSRVVACGEVGGLLTSQMPGMVMPGDELVIGLREQGDSGLVGIAVLTADGASTSIRLILASGLVEDESVGDG
jgi:hypothetical protein